MDSMGAGIVWRQCSFRVAQSWELRNLSKAVAQAELRNPRSCASRVAQSWKLRKRSCAILEVAQAKFRNPSCAILVAQSGEVAESDFIRKIWPRIMAQHIASVDENSETKK